MLQKCHFHSTGDWAISNDTLGRIQMATGHGITTTHGHDTFGNKISHSASPTPSTMINWNFPVMANNRVPTTTSSGAQTWWQYSANGEATQIGKAPGGAYIQFGWDALGLLKAVSDNGNSHEFTYNPSGLRVRDKRTASGAHVHDKRYVYTTGGVLMSAYELNSGAQVTGRRDVVYANGEAIAEIDGNGDVYELHNNYLGTPRYITNGNTSQSNKGQVVGEQSFGPYGEQMIGTFSGKQLPAGYRPLTGYTGHLNEDLTGLIYMKGRYYSPLWHRFINSDQGLDPNSLNQFAYVNGRPFMAADPSGMRMCYYLEFTRELPTVDSPKGASVGVQIHTVLLYCDFDGPIGGNYDSGGRGDGGDLWGGGGRGASSQGQNSQQAKNEIKTDCDDFIFKSHAAYNDVRNLYFANIVYRNMVGGAGVEFGAWAIFDGSNNYQGLNQNWTWEIPHTRPRDKRVPAGARAMIHTHPYNLMTSRGDNRSARDIKMPVYAISHLGISKYDPATYKSSVIAGPNWMDGNPCKK